MSQIDNGPTESVATPVFPAPEFLEEDTAAIIDNNDDDLEYDDSDDTDSDDTAGDDSDDQGSRPIRGSASKRSSGPDRGATRRIAAKALALQAASDETRDLLKTLLGSSSDDAASLTVDIMVGSSAEARRVGNALVALRTEFDEDPVAAGFAVMELDRDSLEQVWKLVHALGQDISPRPPAATGKAVRPLAKAVSQIDTSTVKLLTDALALTSRS